MKLKTSILVFFITISCFSLLWCESTIRQPAVAGQFYPDDPIQLSQDIQNYLNSAESKAVPGDVLGMVVPHAGYAFSAPTAAAAFNIVKDEDFDLVVVIAPSHRDPIRGATVYPGDAYETPLGRITVDKEAARLLVNSCRDVSFSDQGHRAEHAVEVQVPFVQSLFSRAKLLPIVVGQYNWTICQDIGRSLAKATGDKKVLFIASSDLYHGQSYQECKASCKSTLQAVTALDPQKLCDGFQSQDYSACGAGPIVIMQVAAMQKGADAAALLAQTNSGDVTGQRQGYVVGYGSVAVYKKQSSQKSSSKAQPIRSDHIEYRPLDRDVQKELIRMARKTIEHYLDQQTIPEFECSCDVMREKRGVFVTLTKNGQLRGCIGHHESDLPLYKLVPQIAAAAAFQDMRFPPVQAHELKDIKIKVSVYLTNVYKINNLDEFQMGEHGIIMRKGNRGATFLPEVPHEAGWTSVEQEMHHLCQKAGLPLDAWKNGAEFWVYKTQVFDENVLKE